MTEAVVAARPKSNRTMLAAILALVLLIAFAAAFYYLGGADLLPGAVTALLTGISPNGTSPPPAAAPPAQRPTATELPSGVDPALAKRMYVEQLESQANIAKLVTGKVASLTLGKVRKGTAGTEIDVRASFRDKTSGPGVLGMVDRQGKWFFSFIAGSRVGKTGGEADSVAPRNVESFASNETTLNDVKVDQDVLNTVLKQQLLSQDVLKRIADGTYTSIAVDKVTPGAGTVTLEVTLSGPKAAVVKGRVICISKDIDGTRTWFITKFTKA